MLRELDLEQKPNVALPIGGLKTPLLLRDRNHNWALKMGIDIHALHFLRNAKKKKPLGDTITIGRQTLYVINSIVKRIVGTKLSYNDQPYCEELLKEDFGAIRVDSIDYSAYENATYVHDMNKPLPADLRGKYDTVYDGGCLEHIYNAPQALENCSLLCRPGGQILHILPTNNFCGHGFWQFSPELFFSLYSESNGYKETEVFVADLSDTRKWYQVTAPSNGRRVTISSATEMYVLVRTVLGRTDFSHSGVLQSDYLYEWEGTAHQKPQQSGPLYRIRRKLKEVPMAYEILFPLYDLLLRPRLETGLNQRNPGLTMIDLKSYL